MEEPSVLDYLKSKLDFRSKNKISIPWEDISSADVLKDDLIEEKITVGIVQEKNEKRPKTIFWKTSFFKLWRLLLALFLALIGQTLLEAHTPNKWIAGIFYAFAAGLLIWAIFKEEFEAAFHPEEKKTALSIEGDWIYFGGSVILCLITFLAYGDHVFNRLNMFIWLMTLLMAMKAFWLPGQRKGFKNWIRGIWGAIKQPAWNIRLTPWSILLLITIVLVIFFRFGELNQIPGEMFSDHAEKLLDVADVLNGNLWTFFPRNTGREAIQMYLTAFMAKYAGTDLSFISLKLGTALSGFLTLIYVYLLGKEIGNKWVGYFAFLLAGIAYWPNVISRVGLRFPLYPLFVAPTLYYLIKGLRSNNRNYFILAGIALGLGLHGYSPVRLLPFVMTAGVILYMLHKQSKGNRTQVVFSWMLLAFFAFILFLPLFRYWMDDPAMFGFRAMTRLGTTERAYLEPVHMIFLKNLWDSLMMFFVHNGDIWVHSVPGRPALGVVSAVLFMFGCILVFMRYIRKRSWLDIFLLLSIPMLMMPSILSLAFPEENPSLNRSGGAMVPVFVIAALGLDGLLSGFRKSIKGQAGKIIAIILAFALLLPAINQNYDLVFNQYKDQFFGGAWNTSQIGDVINSFSEITGDSETAYVVPFPHWVDTRLVGINAGYPLKDFALWPEHFEDTLVIDAPKLFIVKPEDEQSQLALKQLYPLGSYSLFESGKEGKDFLMFFVP